uniref:Methyltransferase-like protein 17, mitochondrial n=1 Tax=Panagrolaimus sp. JU765 TaxID=591449 RepID=A0AC34RAN7_9BILA
MKPSVIFYTRVLPKTVPLGKQKKNDSFNRTYEDGMCHVTSVNACTNEVNVLKLTPMKNFVSIQTPKLFPLPAEAVSGLRTAISDCKRTGKIFQHEADQLFEKLNQRRFPASPKEVQSARKKIMSKLKLDEDSDAYLSPEHFSQKIRNAQEKYVNREVHKQLKKTRYNWKPLDFKTKEDAAVFSLSQMAPYYAETRKVLNEFRRVDFKPETVLDYGSGCGSVFWAVRDIWPDVGDYCLVDINDNISQFAMDVMRNSTDSEDSVPKNVYFRRALVPSPQKKYDLVIVHRLLIEIGSHEQRLDLISQLWSRTNRFLVIIESSLEDSFDALMQARNFILTNGVKMDSSALKELLIAQGIYTDEVEQIVKDKQMSYSEKFLLLREKLPNPEKLPTFIETGHVFAPCPHDGGCPLLDLPVGKRSCKFFARYNEIRADEKSKSQSADGTNMSAFSYCILEKGIAQGRTAGRLLDKSKSSGCVSCKVCTPFDGVQRFPVSKRAGPLYQLAKSSVPGQLFPLDTDIVASDSEYHIVREMLKEELEGK